MKKILNIKPKNHSISYEYICSECGLNHWLSDIETKTKNFKIACECGVVLIPKRIKSIDIIYYEKDNKATTKKAKKFKIDQDLLEKTCCCLQTYGFEKEEIEPIVIQILEQHGTINQLELVKMVLKTFGEKNEQFFQTNSV
jgi:DNA-directed RNA polymerase subunit RPC12/RpoP